MSARKQQSHTKPRTYSKSMQLIEKDFAATWLTIAALAETLGDHDRAAMAYDATLKHDGASIKALTHLANLYRSRDMFQKATELYEKALAVNANLPDVWATLGQCYLMLDELQKAYTAYQQALQYLENPNEPKLWHGIGILYDRYGSYEYAEEAFAKVLELDPNFEKANEIYFRLGVIYNHQQRWEQALKCFQYILAQPPAPLTKAEISFQIGCALDNMGQWEDALNAYEQALAATPQNAKLLQRLGCLYAMPKTPFTNSQKALEYIEKSLEYDPTDQITWYHLGRLYMENGNNYPLAYEAFQNAMNRDPTNAVFWCSVGVLYYKTQQYKDALDAYLRAIKLNPYVAEFWYNLGTLYEAIGNHLSEAGNAYQQAIQLDPDNKYIKERLEALSQQLIPASTPLQNTAYAIPTKFPQLTTRMAVPLPNLQSPAARPSMVPSITVSQNVPIQSSDVNQYISKMDELSAAACQLPKMESNGVVTEALPGLSALGAGVGLPNQPVSVPVTNTGL